MLSNSIYEFPLNERIRIFMRLENLFAQISHFSEHPTIWDSQATLVTLLEILSIMERFDTKNEVIKELEKTISALDYLRDTPGIEQEKLDHTLDDLGRCLYELQAINGKLLKTLREDDLLNTIKQRTTNLSGINGFEIPSYYYWLNQNVNHRQEQIDQWLSESIPVANAIGLILDLLRNSADFVVKSAENGFFQTSLANNQVCQMLRIALPETANFFPETSGNKHRVSVRFLSYTTTKQRPTQVNDSIDFHMSFCGI